MLRGWLKSFNNGHLVYKLLMIANAANHGAEPTVLEVCGIDIRTLRVLRLIVDEPGITFAEITSLAFLEKSLASRLIQTLVREGYVERRSAPEDARRFELFPLEKGNQTYQKAEMIRHAGLSLLLEPLTPHQAEELEKSLEKIAVWLDSDAFEERAEKARQSLPR